MTDVLVERVKERSHLGTLPCTAAHTAAWEMQASPRRIGEIADELKIRIDDCQLGLFGYGPKEEGTSKLMRPMPEIDPAVKAAIEARAKNGRVACRVLWDIARELNIERLAVGNTADAMGMKIVGCQLGAF